MSGYLLNVIHCSNTRRVVRAALDGGWEWVGYTKSGHVEICWPKTGALLHCATTPGDANSWKAFARDIEKVSGVTVWRKGNRRRSRKSLRRSPDPEVEASRRRHAEQVAREAARAALVESNRRRQELAAQRAAEDDRRRREIESLMQPGW